MLHMLMMTILAASIVTQKPRFVRNVLSAARLCSCIKVMTLEMAQFL